MTKMTIWWKPHFTRNSEREQTRIATCCSNMNLIKFRHDIIEILLQVAHHNRNKETNNNI